MRGSYIVDPDPSVFSNLIIGDMFTPVSSSIIVTPEPNTMLLLGLDLIAVAGIRRKIRR